MGDPQLATNNRTRNACIATAIGLVVLLAAVPTAAADDEPEVQDDGSATYGDCLFVNPWATPPTYHLSLEDCIEI